jgi:hypothetical protein
MYDAFVNISGLHLAAGADVTLDHLRVYSYALPVDDLGAEASCTNYGSCANFGIASWQAPDPQLPVPANPFVPPTLRYVTGVCAGVA